MIVLDIHCMHQMFIGRASLDFGNIEIGNIAKIYTSNAVWQVNSWYKFVRRCLSNVLLLRIVEG